MEKGGPKVQSGIDDISNIVCRYVSTPTLNMDKVEALITAEDDGMNEEESAMETALPVK